jgi:hypothetical protein
MVYLTSAEGSASLGPRFVPSSTRDIASVASPGRILPGHDSHGVKILHLMRAQFMPGSAVGYDLFDHLIENYPRFYPTLSRAMRVSRDLRGQIELYCIEPLALCTRLILCFTLSRCQPRDLACRFEEGICRYPELRELAEERLASVLEVFLAARDGRQVWRQRWSELHQFLTETAKGGEHVLWALLDPIEIYLRALMWYRKCGSRGLGQFLYESLEKWASEMPITDLWTRLSLPELDQELRFLKQSFLRGEVARQGFGRRLSAQLKGCHDRVQELKSNGFLPTA